jgi:hypothetical protein
MGRIPLLTGIIPMLMVVWHEVGNIPLPFQHRMQPEMKRVCGEFIGVRVSIDPILEVMVDMICMDGQKFLSCELVVWGINLT